MMESAAGEFRILRCPRKASLRMGWDTRQRLEGGERTATQKELVSMPPQLTVNSATTTGAHPRGALLFSTR